MNKKFVYQVGNNKKVKKRQESDYNRCRGWTQMEYQNKRYNINQKDEGTLDDRGRHGGTKIILRIKQQGTCLILHEHDDDDDDDDGDDIILALYQTVHTCDRDLALTYNICKYLVLEALLQYMANIVKYY